MNRNLCLSSYGYAALVLILKMLSFLSGYSSFEWHSPPKRLHRGNQRQYWSCVTRLLSVDSTDSVGWQCYLLGFASWLAIWDRWCRCLFGPWSGTARVRGCSWRWIYRWIGVESDGLAGPRDSLWRDRCARLKSSERFEWSLAFAAVLAWSAQSPSKVCHWD